MSPLRVYTDGACSGNPGPGGWAWASSSEHSAQGGEPSTTNNRMELTAVLRAVEDNSGPLVVVMDSTYVKNGIEKWSKSWIRNGWKTRSGEPVKNQDLWQSLVAAVDGRAAGELQFEWVKGHSGDPLNDLVDALAVEERDRHRGSAGSGSSATSAPSPSGARLADLPPAEQRSERRRRDPRIPDGHLVLVSGVGPDRLGGWDDHDRHDELRHRLTELWRGMADITPDLVVVSGLRPGAEMIGAEAALRADVPYVAIEAFPESDRYWSDEVRARHRDLTGRSRRQIRLEKKVPSGKDDFAKAMRRRDAWLAAAADEAILVWDEDDARLARMHKDLDRRLGENLMVLHP